jgi:hypothetical protein
MDMLKNLLQPATYWAPGPENKYGEQSFAAPVLIATRWEEHNEQIRKATGEEVISTTRVFVDREVLVDGFLQEGDYTAQLDPNMGNARVIQTTAVIPDIRNVSKERKAYL